MRKDAQGQGLSLINNPVYRGVLAEEAKLILDI